MINTFFIGDLHLGHKNIIGYNRPQFNNLDEMHEAIITNWNAVVRPRDNVWVTGDVCFGKHNMHYMAQLNGNKRLIMGNHDHYPIEEYLLYFKRIFGVTEYKGCCVTHVPIHGNQFYRFKLNIHGHVHHVCEELAEDQRYFNTCADHINLTPIEWEEIKLQRKDNFVEFIK